MRVSLTINCGASYLASTINSDNSTNLYTFGRSIYGGSNSLSTTVKSNIRQIYKNNVGFSLITKEGIVHTWGRTTINSNSTFTNFNNNISNIFSSSYSFASINTSGRVNVWGFAGQFNDQNRGNFGSNGDEMCYSLNGDTNNKTTITGGYGQDTLYLYNSPSLDSNGQNGNTLALLGDAANNNITLVDKIVIATQKVVPNRKVKQGDVIGTVGSTGRSTGAHLDVRLNWFQTRLDPATVLDIK